MTFMVFIDKFMEKPSDAMIITGDIAEGDSFHEYLALMAEAYKKPIYYVLGNHDYYKRSFAEVKEQVKLLDSSAKYKNLFCMDNNGIVKLTDKTCLVGYGGWYDARYGNYWSGGFDMADFHEIKDLIDKDHQIRYNKFNYLGDITAEHIRHYVYKAFQDFDNVIFMTHVPPFAEASKYGSDPSPSYSLPFFSCKAAGEALLDVMEGQPENKKLTVIAGHSHYKAFLKVSDQISVYVADAQYYYPKVYTTLEIR